MSIQSIDPFTVTEADHTERARRTPHVLMRPQVFPDGDMWCALYGENIQDGVAGFGETPAKACADFDGKWSAGTLKGAIDLALPDVIERHSVRYVREDASVTHAACEALSALERTHTTDKEASNTAADVLRAAFEKRPHKVGRTDTERLDWLLDTFGLVEKSRGGWEIEFPHNCLSAFGCGATPRAAIDDAIDQEKAQ